MMATRRSEGCQLELTMSPPGLTLFPGAGGPPAYAHDITGGQLLTAVRVAEEAGFSNVLVPWHVVVSTGEWENNMGPRWPNPLAAAGMFLGATERIKVIPLAVAPCLEPIDLAKAFATLQWMSEGRCIPVLLAGYIKWEFDLLGAEYEHRDQVTDEYVEAMQRLWRGEQSFKGKFLDYDDVVFDPR